ncbi:hypothetical protein F9278_23135 [Streptomyces phaeolivaceus]|uniref:Uncharacterized protein n=1 Tax=Streptomyces phaeolivaceus TaxID=2653200 RepID=A0A5P8K5L1_9ACTN|nr:hypothetical protein [Streptomyces phaeolivaceus]QFQ98575.1 hypothetical protein F9278_23135 [Streptomyces phaeolivaceus]
MTVLLFVLVVLVVVLAAGLVKLWRRVQLSERQGAALRAGLDGVRVQLQEHVDARQLHTSKLVVITDRADAESYALMQRVAGEGR